MPTPGCSHVDAFTYDWNLIVPYCFPPFSLYLKCFNHIRTARVHKAYFIIPWHPTAVWFPLMLSMLVKDPVFLPKNTGKRLYLPFPKTKVTGRAAEKFEFSFCPFIREVMIRNGISDNVAHYCSDHWTPLTIRCYEYKLRFWREFAAAKCLHPFDITQEHILQMLIFMFEVQKKKVRTIRSTFTVGRLLCRAAGCPFSVQEVRQVHMLLQGMFK